MRANRLPLVSTGPATAPSLGYRAGGGAGPSFWIAARSPALNKPGGDRPYADQRSVLCPAANPPTPAGEGCKACVRRSIFFALSFFACVAERQTLGAVDAAPIPGFAGSSPAACTIPDPVVAVLRGHEGITSRWERRGGDRVMFLHTDAAATARVHGPQRWLDEGLPLRPTSLHTRAPRLELDSPSSPFPVAPAHGGRQGSGCAHLSLRRSA